MNTRKLLVSVLLVCVLFSACAPAAPSVPAAIPSTPTSVPTPVQTTVSPNRFGIPMSLSFGNEWSVLEEYADVVTLVSDKVDVDLAFIIVKDARLADPKNSFAQVAFPDDFVTWVQEHGLFTVVETQPIVVGGFQGTQINAVATEDCGAKKNWLFLSTTGWNCRKDEHYRFIYLNDVNGERVLIMNSGGPSSEKDFNQGVEASQQVLDTVVFTKS